MKKLAILSVLFFSVLTLRAQTLDSVSVNDRFFEMKVREMVYRLEITDSQKTEFVAVYKRFTDEMRSVFGERRQPQKPQTAQEAAEIEKMHIMRQQRAQAVRLKYVDELSKVLNANQLHKFFEVESDIQRKLRERREKAGIN